MFWADEIAKEVKKRKLPLEWVDDMKTPSGRIHVGGLRAVTTHDIVYKALVDAGVKAKFTYVFDNHDPMDGLPAYLSKEKYEQYLGMPLFMIPSPKEAFENYAEYFAQEFRDGFNQIGCKPEIIWGTDLYFSGKMNEGIRKCLDSADKIRKIYEDLYKKAMAKEWHPFNVYCPQCQKVSTTKTIDWDGEQVTFECRVNGLDFTKGCGYKGKVSPFATKEKIAGKIPWKVEWAVKWQAIGITVEGAGKDHMTKGGSHDLAKRVAEEILGYPTPYSFAHEFFLVGGRKMSSSKGTGVSVVELLEILPPQLMRFLIARTKLNQAINFDPYEPTTIPKLFDEYDKYKEAYVTGSDPAMKRTYELSQVKQVGPAKETKLMRFSDVVNLLQMPGKEKELERPDVTPRVKYAKIWLDRFAPEDQKFNVKEEFPEAALHLSAAQREFLLKVIEVIESGLNASDLQTKLYEASKELKISSKDAFAAVYSSLIGKDHGPKAAWLIASLDKKFVIDRFKEASVGESGIMNSARGARLAAKREARQGRQELGSLNKPEVFSIDPKLKEKFPSVSVGVAIIKGVKIEKTNKELEGEKEKVLNLFTDLTTEQLGQYLEVVSYRKLYKEMGVDWHSRRPSPEALLRRIALKKGLYTINTCVDAYNLVVIKHRVSVGAFDLDKIKLPTMLRMAKEAEEILLLGDREPTQYKEGEVAYFDEQGGFNIDFNYRDAQRTAVQLSTQNLYINVDGVFDITPKKVEQVLKETCDVIMKYCGGKLELFGVETA